MQCLRIVSSGGFCEDTDEHSIPISSWEFVDKLSDYKFIKECALLSIKTSVALVHDQTIPTELPPLVGEVSANVCG
jgi:hypothetical protein